MVNISPELFKFIIPVDVVDTIAPPKDPVGAPPPKRTYTPPAGRISPDGNICLGEFDKSAEASKTL
jgi:hypothetical protein